MKIWLDDDPIRDSWVDDTWTIVRTVEGCLELLSENCGLVEVLSLDHDLGKDDDGFLLLTGYDVLTMLEHLVGSGELRPVILPERFEIHSANPVGRKNMQAAIDSIERIRSASTS